MLKEAGEPLHYGEITRRVLEGGFWSTTGKTPEATVNPQLAVDIKRRGEQSLFRRTEQGVFALRAWGGVNPQTRPQPALPVTHLSFMVTGDVVRTRMAVQVKRWKANVQAPAVQQVRGSLGAHEQGLIITTSDFSKGASRS